MSAITAKATSAPRLVESYRRHVAALATIRPAAAATDPILAAIEAHKFAAAATSAAQKRFCDFRTSYKPTSRLQRDRWKEDETRRGEEIETAVEGASL